MSRNLVSDEVSWFWIMLSQIYGARPLTPVIGKLLFKRDRSKAHTSSDNLLNKARLSAFLNSSIVL
jgi:hypothetical protein